MMSRLAESTRVVPVSGDWVRAETGTSAGCKRFPVAMVSDGRRTMSCVRAALPLPGAAPWPEVGVFLFWIVTVSCRCSAEVTVI